MPNKYNVRAKRLSLDNMIRERSWNAFQNSFSQLSQHNNKLEDIDVGGRIDGKSSSAGDANLCQAIVQCRNHQTTHRTLLHSLCDIPSDTAPPSELIKSVASACPRSLLLHESGNERTPLHLAIAQHASLDTIKALIESASNRESLLLALDSKGQTPLLTAVREGVQDDIIKYLVNTNIDGSSLLICGRRKKKQQHQYAPLKYVASNESTFVGEGLDTPQDLLRFMIVRTYRAKLRKTFPLYQRIQGKDDQANLVLDIDSDTCLLQASIFCYELIGSSKVASSILSYVIRNRLFHRERLNSRKDHAGNNTLHIACLSDTKNFDQILRLGDRISDYGLNGEDCTLMEYLVKAPPAPSTSPYLCQNFLGEIPLHCAIKTAKDWIQLQLLVDACPSSVKACTSKGELPLHLAIKCGSPITNIMRIWNYYPEAASRVDRSTGLHPFQLAAIFGDKRQSWKGKQKKKLLRMKGTHPEYAHEHAGEAWDETSLSFFLLRECPSLISTSV